MSSLKGEGDNESLYRTLTTLFRGTIGKKEWAIAQTFLLKLNSETIYWKNLSGPKSEETQERLDHLILNTKAFYAVFANTPFWAELM